MAVEQLAGPSRHTPTFGAVSQVDPSSAGYAAIGSIGAIYA